MRSLLIELLLFPATLCHQLMPSAFLGKGTNCADQGSACPAGTVPWEDGSCEPLEAATAAAKAHLRSNMFAFDKANEATYFEAGIAISSVELALRARQRFGWAGRVPHTLWRQFVLPFASVNEARTNWRRLMWDALTVQPWLLKLSNDTSVERVAVALNQQMWTDLRPNQSPIVFRPDQTPLIFDSISTIAFGYASCTGISISYVNALRTLGIPARLVGTPAWHGRPKDGNHNWVEVLTSDGWRFIEGAPAGPGETFSNYCDKWFCHPDRFFRNGTGTRVFAAVYGPPTTFGAHYPMAWDIANRDVGAIDRSDWYDAVCSACS